jgi:adenylate cyclase
MIAKASRRLPLGIRLSGLITLLAISAMALLSLVILGKQSALQNEQLRDLGNTLSTQMASAITESVFTNDETSLKVQVQQFSQLPRIRAIQVADQQQVLAFAGDVEALFTHHDSDYFFRSDIRFKDVVGGEVHLLLEANTLAASYAQMLQLVVGVIGVLSLLALVAAYVISRRISKPIGELLSATTDISAKDFNKQRHDEADKNHHDRRHDEWDQLREAVNQMGHGLYQKTQIEQRLAGFVNKEIAEQIINELDTVQLGCERVDASVMFADIVGFTVE